MSKGQMMYLKWASIFFRWNKRIKFKNKLKCKSKKYCKSKKFCKSKKNNNFKKLIEKYYKETFHKTLLFVE